MGAERKTETSTSPRRLAGDARKARELDKLIHERARLAIVSALGSVPEMSFVELKDALGLTDGNLSVHARKLEEAGYLACDKGFDGRVPRTTYRLTDEGRQALADYVDHMESILRTVRRG